MQPLLYEASVVVMLRHLDRLDALLDAVARDASPAALLDAALASDMLPFGEQVEIAINFTVRTCFPLAGLPRPGYPVGPRTVEGLRDRVMKARRLLQAFDPSQFNDDARVIADSAGEADITLPAPRYLFEFALPNFFFHVCMAHAILRSRGVPVGKADFDGWHRYATSGTNPPAPTS